VDFTLDEPMEAATVNQARPSSPRRQPPPHGASQLNEVSTNKIGALDDATARLVVRQTVKG